MIKKISRNLQQFVLSKSYTTEELIQIHAEKLEKEYLSVTM